MAYNSFTTEEDLKKQQDGTAPVQPAGSTALVSSSSAAGQSTGKGTGWTNLQTYLDNNAGQGVSTTQKIIDPKQNQINDAVTSLNTNAAQAQKDIAGGVIQKNTDLEKKLASDPTNAVNDFKSYTSSAYKGPASYSPGADVYSKFNGITPNVDIANITNPGEIKKSVGDAGYTFGMGALDGYLINSEGQGVVNKFNDTNKNVIANKDATIKSVNDMIPDAINTSKSNIASAQSAADQSYQSWLKKAQDTRYAGYDQSYADVTKQAEDKLRASNTALPKDMNNWVSPNSKYSWQDSVDPATLAALNSLAGIDSDSSTNGYTKGTNSAVDFDWGALDKYISDAHPVTPPPVVTRTENTPTVTKNGSPNGGDIGGKGETRTTNADGSYTIVTDSGVTINYNKDGTIKGKIIDPKNVLT